MTTVTEALRSMLSRFQTPIVARDGTVRDSAGCSILDVSVLAFSHAEDAELAELLAAELNRIATGSAAPAPTFPLERCLATTAGNANKEVCALAKGHAGLHSNGVSTFWDDAEHCVTRSAPRLFSAGGAVDHPEHYRPGTYEAIRVIEAWGLGFCLGNTVKYVCRAGRKDAAKTVEDLEKARWYLDREIQRLKEQEEQR